MSPSCRVVMSAICVVVVMTASGTEHARSLRVLMSPAEGTARALRLRCERAEGEGEGEGTLPVPHPLDRPSWIIFTGTEGDVNEKKSLQNGELELQPAREWRRDSRAVGVTCRVPLAPAARARALQLAPPIFLHLTPPPNASPSSGGPSLRSVWMELCEGSACEAAARAAEVRMRAGRNLSLSCFAIGLPEAALVALYIIHVTDMSESGRLETEIAATVPADRHRRVVTTALTVPDSYNMTQVYCLARWFLHADPSFEWPRAARSRPHTLRLMPPTEPDPLTGDTSQSSPYLWVAIGVGSVGWLLLLVTFALLLYLRKRRRSPHAQPHTAQEVHRVRVASAARAAGAGAGAGGVSEARAALGLVPADTQLRAGGAGGLARRHTPPAPATAPADEHIYSNVQEVNTLLLKWNM